MTKRDCRDLDGPDGWPSMEPSPFGSPQLMHARDLDPASIEGDRFEPANAQGSHAELEDEPGNPRDILPDDIRDMPGSGHRRLEAAGDDEEGITARPRELESRFGPDFL